MVQKKEVVAIFVAAALVAISSLAHHTNAQSSGGPHPVCMKWQQECAQLQAQKKPCPPPPTCTESIGTGTCAGAICVGEKAKTQGGEEEALDKDLSKLKEAVKEATPGGGSSGGSGSGGGQGGGQQSGGQPKPNTTPANNNNEPIYDAFGGTEGAPNSGDGTEKSVADEIAEYAKLPAAGGGEKGAGNAGAQGAGPDLNPDDVGGLDWSPTSGKDGSGQSGGERSIAENTFDFSGEKGEAKDPGPFERAFEAAKEWAGQKLSDLGDAAGKMAEGIYKEVFGSGGDDPITNAEEFVADYAPVGDPDLDNQLREPTVDEVAGLPPIEQLQQRLAQKAPEVPTPTQAELDAAPKPQEQGLLDKVWEGVKDGAKTFGELVQDGLRNLADGIISPAEAQPRGVGKSVVASTYGWDKGSGDSSTQPLASGSSLDKRPWVFAERSGKFGEKFMFTNPATGESVVLERADRGPYTKDASGNYARQIDLSRAAAEEIGQGYTVKSIRMTPVSPDTPLGPVSNVPVALSSEATALPAGFAERAVPVSLNYSSPLLDTPVPGEIIGNPLSYENAAAGPSFTPDTSVEVTPQVAYEPQTPNFSEVYNPLVVRQAALEAPAHTPGEALDDAYEQPLGSLPSEPPTWGSQSPFAMSEGLREALRSTAEEINRNFADANRAVNDYFKDFSAMTLGDPSASVPFAQDAVPLPAGDVPFAQDVAEAPSYAPPEPSRERQDFAQQLSQLPGYSDAANRVLANNVNITNSLLADYAPLGDPDLDNQLLGPGASTPFEQGVAPAPLTAGSSAGDPGIDNLGGAPSVEDVNAALSEREPTADVSGGFSEDPTALNRVPEWAKWSKEFADFARGAPEAVAEAVRDAVQPVWDSVARNAEALFASQKPPVFESVPDTAGAAEFERSGEGTGGGLRADAPQREAEYDARRAAEKAGETPRVAGFAQGTEPSRRLGADATNFSEWNKATGQNLTRANREQLWKQSGASGKYEGTEKQNRQLLDYVKKQAGIRARLGTPTLSTEAPTVGGAGGTLSQWFGSRGESLPSLSERRALYTTFYGLGASYSGTAAQNARLLEALKARY